MTVSDEHVITLLVSLVIVLSILVGVLSVSLVRLSIETKSAMDPVRQYCTAELRLAQKISSKSWESTTIPPISAGYQNVITNNDIVVGDYVCKRNNAIGCGAFGEVSIGHHRALDDFKVAIKVIWKSRLDERTRRLIRNEIPIMKELSGRSQYIVKILDGEIRDDRVAIVMEYCDGGDLDAALVNDALFGSAGTNAWSEQRMLFGGSRSYSGQQFRILECFYQIALAIKVIHARNIIHRDLKPGNVLLASSNSARPWFTGLRDTFKLSDFGISRRLDANGMASTCVGTRQFVAPEVAAGQRYDKRADYYAFGKMLYMSLTKVMKHVSTSTEDDYIVESASVQMPESKQPLSGLWSVNPYVLQVVKRLMHKNPAKRATADDFIALFTPTSSGQYRPHMTMAVPVESKLRLRPANWNYMH